MLNEVKHLFSIDILKKILRSAQDDKSFRFYLIG